MFKKIILLAAVIASYSFATWDYFGLLQNSQGSFKAGLYYDTDDDWSQMGLRVAARMNVTPQFELSLQGFGYQFWGETDCPEDIIVLSDGRKLCFKLSSDGISLFNGISHFEPDSNGFEWISIGDPLCHLIKTNLDNTVPGRWPEASMSLLTRGYLANYPVDVLRLIRNEIFARHGHRFSNQKLNDFFLSEGIWYSTALLSQQSPTELSEIELLNVQLILSLEKERKQRTDL